MFLLNIRIKFIKELTLIGIVLTGIVAFVFHLFIPERYFLWFPAIPIFFYLFGLLYIYLFAFGYRQGLEKLASVYLLCKTMKFLLSLLVLLFYGVFIRHEVVAFFTTFIGFFFAFLVFETRFFLRLEAKLKLRKQYDEKKSNPNHAAAAPAADTFKRTEGTGA